MESNVENLFKNYSESLDPSPGQEVKVKEMVFAKLKQRSKFNLLSFVQMKDFLFKKKFIAAASLVFILLFVFVATPLIFIGGDLKELLLQDDGLSTIDTPNDEVKTNTSGDEEARIDSNAGSTDADYYLPEPSPPNEQDTKTPEIDRAKEKSGSLSIDVDDIDAKLKDVNRLIISAGGIVQSSNLNVYNSKKDLKTASIVFIVPVDKFDGVLDELKSLALEINSENISSIDRQSEVTSISQTIDELNKKIDELKKLLVNEKDQYSRINIQNQIDSLVLQKEAQEKSLTELTKKTVFSKLSLTITEEKSDKAEITANWEKTLESTKMIIQFWVNVGLWLIPVSILCLPPAAILAIIILVIRARRKRKS